MDVKLSGGLQLVKNTVEVNIKKLVIEAVIPRYAKSGDAGLDMTAISMVETDMYIEYGTGIAIQLPQGYYATLVPRSSISNYDLVLANSPGTVDTGYTGEIKFRFKRTVKPRMAFKSPDMDNLIDCSGARLYNIGDRVGQLIVLPFPRVIFNEVAELEETSRSSTGFGSSGL